MIEEFCGYKPTGTQTTTATLPNTRWTFGKNTYAENPVNVTAVHRVRPGAVITRVSAMGRSPNLPTVGTSEYAVYLTDPTGSTQTSLVAILGTISNPSSRSEVAHSSTLNISLESYVGYDIKLAVNNDSNYRRAYVSRSTGDTKIGGAGFTDPYGVTSDSTQIPVMWMTISYPKTPSVSVHQNEMVAGHVNHWNLTGVVPTSVTFAGLNITTFDHNTITMPDYTNGAIYPSFGTHTLIATDGTITVETLVELVPETHYTYTTLLNVSNYSPGYIQGWTNCAVNDQVVFNKTSFLEVEEYSIDSDGCIQSDRTTGSDLSVWVRRNNDGLMKQLTLKVD